MNLKNSDSFNLSSICKESSLALEVIQSHLRKTPCRLSEDFSEQLGFDLYLKLENLQRTGSFKTRGSMYAISKLDKVVFTTISLHFVVLTLSPFGTLVVIT